MMSAGALDEVACIVERDLTPDLPAMRALGVPSLMAHLRGEIGLDRGGPNGENGDPALCQAAADLVSPSGR